MPARKAGWQTGSSLPETLEQKKDSPPQKGLSGPSTPQKTIGNETALLPATKDFSTVFGPRKIPKP